MRELARQRMRATKQKANNSNKFLTSSPATGTELCARTLKAVCNTYGESAREHAVSLSHIIIVLY